jgi:hypothetical protein
MLFDTSVWIDFSKGKKTTAADLLEKEIYSGRRFLSALRFIRRFFREFVQILNLKS